MAKKKSSSGKKNSKSKKAYWGSATPTGKKGNLKQKKTKIKTKPENLKKPVEGGWDEKLFGINLKVSPASPKPKKRKKLSSKGNKKKK